MKHFEIQFSVLLILFLGNNAIVGLKSEMFLNTAFPIASFRLISCCQNWNKKVFPTGMCSSPFHCDNVYSNPRLISEAFLDCFSQFYI